MPEKHIHTQEYERSVQAQKAIEYLHIVGASDIFKDDESKLEFLRTVNSHEFLDILVNINNLLRNKGWDIKNPDGKMVVDYTAK